MELFFDKQRVKNVLKALDGLSAKEAKNILDYALYALPEIKVSLHADSLNQTLDEMKDLEFRELHLRFLQNESNAHKVRR